MASPMRKCSISARSSYFDLAWPVTAFLHLVRTLGEVTS